MIGLDIGYNSVKWKSDIGEGDFLSIVGTPDLSNFSVDNKNERVLSIPGDGDWIFGEQAISNSRFAPRKEDREWIESLTWYRLFLQALSLGVSRDANNINIVLGLPTSYFKRDSRKILTTISGKHNFIVKKGDIIIDYEMTVNKIRVIPQPFGTLLNYAITDDLEFVSKYKNSKTGVIDIGGKTTNILFANGLKDNSLKSTSINVGGWDIVRGVKDVLLDKYPDSEYTDAEVDLFCRDGKIKRYGKEISISDIISDISKPAIEVIMAEISQRWGAGVELDNVIITGGGSYLFGPQIKDFHDAAIVAENPRFSNVRGYYKFGKIVFS